jgi:hypothetical protein
LHRGALFLLILILGGCSSARGLFLTQQSFLGSHEGFCAEGVYGPTSWPEGRPKDIHVWGSYCDQGDRTVGSAVSLPFRASRAFALYLSGYPNGSGIELSLENLADHSKLALRPHETPGTRWLEYCFQLPKSWVGKPVRLVASDGATGAGGWLGFSRPIPVAATWNFAEAANLLLRTTSHFVLLFVICFAACAYVVWRGVRDVAVIGLVALVGIAAPGYVTFWLWLLSPRIGHAVSFLIPPLAGVTLVFLLRRIGRSGRAVLSPLLSPAMLMFLSSLWILSAGFAYGGIRAPFVTAWTRFSHPLPPDNILPYLFAEGVRYGHVPHPLLGDWLSSDRPPLQTAIALSQYPYLPQPRALGQEALSVVLQSSWILALWILLVAFDVDTRAIRLVLATILFWGFTLVNSFFVWPKLLAASYMVGLCAILLVDKFTAELKTSRLLPVIAGALLAFGLLAHGGSAFALIGVFFTLLVRRKHVPARALALMVVSCALLYLPWFLYQKLYDPPGNYLLKLQLAGVTHVDNESILRDLGTAYSRLSLRQWLDGRNYNVSMVIDHQREYWHDWENLIASIIAGRVSGAYQVARELRSASFFYFGPNLGLLVTGPFFLVARFRKKCRTHEGNISALLWMFVICTLIPWCLIMFTPGSTSIHQGTYVAVLLASAGSVLAIWAASRWLAYAVSALQILQSILIYGVFMRQSPSDGVLLEGTAHYGIVALFFVTFILCWFAITRVSIPRVTALEGKEGR